MAHTFISLQSLRKYPVLRRTHSLHVLSAREHNPNYDIGIFNILGPLQKIYPFCGLCSRLKQAAIQPPKTRRTMDTLYFNLPALLYLFSKSLLVELCIIKSDPFILIFFRLYCPDIFHILCADNHFNGEEIHENQIPSTFGKPDTEMSNKNDFLKSDGQSGETALILTRTSQLPQKK